MWCKKVLVAYDGSAASDKAVEMAKAILESRDDASMVLVHIVRLGGTGGVVGLDAMISEEAQSVTKDLEEIADSIPNECKVEVLVGTSPSDLIVKCAQDNDCDLIIMGSRGKGGVKGFLGSVSYAVTKESPIAVLITKEDAK